MNLDQATQTPRSIEGENTNNQTNQGLTKKAEGWCTPQTLKPKLRSKARAQVPAIKESLRDKIEGKIIHNALC